MKILLIFTQGTNNTTAKADIAFVESNAGGISLIYFNVMWVYNWITI